MKLPIVIDGVIAYSTPMNSAVTSSGDHKASEALGLWEPKRSLTLEAARKHSKRIKFLRRALMTVSAGLLAYLVYGVITGGSSGFDFDDNPAESVKMVGPRYSGRTDNDQPYYLTAESATRTLANRSEVELKNPVLEFIREEGAASSFIVAKKGIYNDVEKILSLQGNVDLKTDDGNNCHTAQAKIFTRQQHIEGRNPISCTGAFGLANGNAFEITDKYKTFTFKNGMDATIQKEKGAPALRGASIKQARSNQAFGGDTPINITADIGTYKGSLTVLTGNVVVIQGKNRTSSNEMDIFRNDASEDSSGSLKLGEINRIDAKGNFRYTTPENDVYGDRGVYENQKEIMTITGKVKVKQPTGNLVETDKLIYNVKTESIRFTGDCAENNCNSRQRVVFQR